MDTTHARQPPPTFDTTEEEWAGHAMTRLDHAQRLLDEIGQVIETVEPGRREHTADLLDSAIETLARLRKRLPPGEPGPPELNPPF